MKRNYNKIVTNEDKFARKFHCNSYRFIRKIKKYNNKKVRRMNKKIEIEQID